MDYGEDATPQVLWSWFWSHKQPDLLYVFLFVSYGLSSLVFLFLQMLVNTIYTLLSTTTLASTWKSYRQDPWLSFGLEESSIPI